MSIIRAYTSTATKAYVRAVIPSLGMTYLPYSDFQTLVASKVTPKITGNDSTFAGAGNWATAFGSLQPDVTTYHGELYLNCTSNNQAIKLPMIFDENKEYLLKIRIKVASGAGTIFDIGGFPAVEANNGIKITPTTEYQWYYAHLYNFGVATFFYLGVINANNNGTKFLIDEIHLDEVSLADWYDLDITKQALSYTDGLWSGLSKSAQTLLTLNVMGDSILANVMGTIPEAEDEGDTMRPTRLVSNNVVRHIYDAIKYNEPTYRRLDHADWTKSGTDFVKTAMESQVGEFVHVSIVANSYCEITIPDGVSNCAIIYYTYLTWDRNDCDDAISVTINGGDISVYGDSTISSYKNASPNKHTISEYKNLPAGANTIRLTHSNSTKSMVIWGVMYWNGNTIKINNHAEGGYPIGTVSAIVMSQITNHNEYNWIIEFPNMNNCGKSITTRSQIRDFLLYTKSKKPFIQNHLHITTHPFGTDPSDGTPNYYKTFNNPLTFKQRSTLDICICVHFGFYYIDLFRLFEKDIIDRGGTLINGESGAYYTADGQHLDEDGVTIFSNYLIPSLPSIPD